MINMMGVSSCTHMMGVSSARARTVYFKITLPVRISLGCVLLDRIPGTSWKALL